MTRTVPCGSKPGGRVGTALPVLRASGKSYHDHLRADCCAAGRVARADAGALREEPERRVLVLERVVGASSPDLAAVVDLDMLLITGGRERTAGEWGSLFTAAGFDVLSAPARGAWTAFVCRPD
ncbi:methyltransferase [Streptomyces sp. NPDC018947]|uniref:methyltransferase n=1 Tax=Streptomyces sp. NPDC018947 TaxID=3365054 RepID=UPI0037A4BED0